LGAKAKTASAPDLDFVIQVVFFEFFAEGLAQLGAGRRRATGAHADGDPAVFWVTHGLLDLR
jgi:hypothetical protein